MPLSICCLSQNIWSWFSGNFFPLSVNRSKLLRSFHCTFSYVFGNLLSLIIYRDPSRYKRSTRLHSNGGWWHNTLLPGDRETYSCVWMVGPKHVLKSSMCHSLNIHWDIFHWDIFHEYSKISVCNLYFSYPPFSTRDDKSSYHRQR